MTKVTMKINPEDQPTNKQIEEIRAASKRIVKFTEDAPELTDEELSEFKPANPKMSDLQELTNEFMKDPEFKKEYEAIQQLRIGQSGLEFDE